jgi:hypothetical protein
MAKIFGLDIPAGLEDLFWNILQFGDNITQDKLILKTARPTRQKQNTWNIQSLFVLWQDLYNGLSFARRSAWTNYWVTLPYGSHSGAGGWPGSGFSAFVYVNAPRYKTGLDLLLDPPGSDELIYNGNFTLFDSGWLVNYGSVDFSGQNAVFSSSLGGAFETDDAFVFTLLPDSIYHIEFDFIATDCDFNLNITQFHGGRYPYNYDASHEPLTHVSEDIYTGSWGESIQCKLFSSAGPNTYSSVDNITLKLKV